MSPPKVKICGITRVEDAEHAARAGADFIGLNFWPQSKRHVSVEAATALAAAARKINAHIEIVGLFVDPKLEDALAIHDRVDLDVFQLHGDESDELIGELHQQSGRLDVWKAHQVHGRGILDRVYGSPATAHVLDAPSAGRGGSGTTFDWAVAAEAVQAVRRIVLAGGLTPDNVAAAIAAVHPYAVDVASGVERAPGIKDPDRVTAFIAAARGAAR